MIVISSSAGDLPGYLAVPDTGRGPGVVVIPEWWGIVPHIESVVERLAAEGFVAIAPDFYRGAATTEPDEAGKLMRGLQIAAVAADLVATADHLERSGLLDAPRVGAMGFCMGGGLALLAPTVSPHIDAAVAFYPAVPWPDYHPLWANYDGRAALIHECEADIPRTGADIERYAREINGHGGQATVETYPGTAHAFFNDDRPEVYDAPAAALSWRRSLDFLHERLDGPFGRGDSAQ